MGDRRVRPRDRALWLAVQRKAATLSPEAARALLAAYQTLRESLSDAALTDLIASGRWAEIVDEATLDRALRPFRERLVLAVDRGVRAAAIDVSFDVLNPRVIDAVRALDSRVINALKADIRETVRAHVENGLRDGVPPRTIARALRPLIGLAPNQAEYVQNYRAELEAGSKAALERRMRNMRYDKATAAGTLTPAQIDRAVTAYEKRLLAFNASTNARTMTTDSLKLGQHLAWQEAIDNGTVDKGSLNKRWVGVMDDRERPEHVLMEGETVGFEEAFSNGEYIPGESTWNCRCVVRYVVNATRAVVAA